MGTDDFPVIRRPGDLDAHSGGWVERLLFNNRVAVLGLGVLVTVLLAVQAPRIRVNAAFEQTIPRRHPYLTNYLRHEYELRGLTNVIRIAVETKRGTIFAEPYLETVRQINDEVLLVPGVDRPFVRSLWTPATRWIAVTEEGLDGGPVIPSDYDGSPASLRQVQTNLHRSGEMGNLVATDLRSSLVIVPLLDKRADTGAPIDYGQLGRRLEDLRASHQNDDIRIHIVGFGKVVGDLIEGLAKMSAFFGLAVLVTTLVLWGYTRTWRNTLVVVLCSLTAVLWLLGILVLLGRILDPYSILVPFLIFAIGVSHGAQKMNGITQDMARGTHRWVAARYTFRRLFRAGFAALATTAAGFAVLAIIDIGVIRAVALVASIGVGLLLFTNLVLLPLLLSYVAVCPPGERRARAAITGQPATRLGRAAFHLLSRCTQRPAAVVVLGSAGLLAVAAWGVSSRLQVGDLEPGAPEFRSDSRYNRDQAFITASYASSSDVLVVMVETELYQCAAYETLAKVDALEWMLGQLPEVQSSRSLASFAKTFSVAMNEGSLDWYAVPRTEGLRRALAARSPRELLNYQCDLLPVFVYLHDHRASTLQAVTDEVEAFAAAHDRPGLVFRLAGGNAGIAAATNLVVQRANARMLIWVYVAIVGLCWVTFRSWRAVVCAALPLALTSLLCEALMVLLGIGVTAATLPVIALGVGLGVDYALYVMSVTLADLRLGYTLPQAYAHALLFTGRVVVLAALTLALSVATWILSPIKFQADMGALLAFMLLWNMVGTLFLLPALGHFLLRPQHLPDPQVARAGTGDPGATHRWRRGATGWRSGGRAGGRTRWRTDLTRSFWGRIRRPHHRGPFGGGAPPA